MSDLDKRAYPRVHLTRPMVLEDGHGTRVKATLRDTTPRGLKAVCDRKSAQALIPREKRGQDRQTLRLTARFKLPNGADLARIEVECRVAHLSIIPDEGLVAIGLSFLSFKGESGKALRRFLVESLEPA